MNPIDPAKQSRGQSDTAHGNPDGATPWDGRRDAVNEGVRVSPSQATASCFPIGSQPPPGSANETVPVPLALIGHPRYEILEFLGSGGMGTVYRARHRLMDRVVALKVINRHLVTNPSTIERFRREVMAAARLDHPNIVPAYDADQAGDTHFLVMKFIEGVPLDRVLAERGRLPIPKACDYARQVALGLQHAHERGMVHRDIKPHNLMLKSGGRVKILDFGLARYASEAVLGEPLVESPSPGGSNLDDTPTEIVRCIPATGLTTGYAAIGTADYMAPEEGVDARCADIRADIYSLGCTLYYLLAGQVPFPGGDSFEKIQRHISETPRPLQEFRADVPPLLAACVSRMMAKNPDDRYATPLEVAEALTPFVVPADRRVLLVEDDTAARANMALILHNQGFAVDLAADGREALAYLRNGSLPVLIMLDLVMSRMDGWEFLREQKADPLLADIPVIIVSSADPRQAVAAALGATDYLQTRMNLDAILAMTNRSTAQDQPHPSPPA